MLKSILIGAVCLACLAVPAKASSDLLPKRAPRGDQMVFQAPALPPMAYTLFCMSYAEECAARAGGEVALTPAAWSELAEVNRQVNQAIVPQKKYGNILQRPWTLSPARGDCADYATTKRHELLARGWPSSALLLAEVVTAWGEHHLVLVAHVQGADLVLDNLSHEIRRWSAAPYQWVRVQSPGEPNFWSKVAPADARIS